MVLLDADLLTLLLGEWVPVSGVLLLKELHLVLQGESLLFVCLVIVRGLDGGAVRRGVLLTT